MKNNKLRIAVGAIILFLMGAVAAYPYYADYLDARVQSFQSASCKADAYAGTTWQVAYVMPTLQADYPVLSVGLKNTATGKTELFAPRKEKHGTFEAWKKIRPKQLVKICKVTPKGDAADFMNYIMPEAVNGKGVLE